MAKTINQMSVQEFFLLPHAEYNKEIRFRSLIILPTKNIHDTGYRCMDYVATDNSLPICRLSGYSDVLHIDGTGGFGYKWLEKYTECPKLVEPKAWHIDCLRYSGLLHIFVYGHDLITRVEGISSFEIYAIKRE